jgi:hypothetical protein
MGPGRYPGARALHYLQMATEKLAKAYRFRDTATSIETLLTRHTGFPEFFNAFLLSPSMRTEYEGRSGQLRKIREDCGHFARAVEQLAPAVDREQHPANAEYPWCAGGRIVTPVRYGYPEIPLLKEARGRSFLNFIERAFVEYSRP